MINFATMLSALWLFGVDIWFYLVASWIGVVGGVYHSYFNE